MPHGMASFGTAYQILPFFLTSHQCQVPSLFPNTYNFVLQTFTPAKISHHKWLSMKSKQFCLFKSATNGSVWQVTQCHFRGQSRCQCPHPPPFQCSSPEKCHKELQELQLLPFFFCFLCRNAGFSTWPVWWIECAVRNTHRSTLAPPVLFDSRTFQGSLQIPSQWNRAFRWWIRFTLRCLDTYMMCQSYDSYELPPPCHNQLRSAQNLGVEKFWSPWKWSEVVQVAKCSQRNDRKSKRHKTCKALVD